LALSRAWLGRAAGPLTAGWLAAGASLLSPTARAQNLEQPVLRHASAPAQPAEPRPPLIPVESFFGTNAIRAARLSPKGLKVGFLAPNRGTYSLAVLDLATRHVSVPVHIEDENIRSFEWKGDDRLIFTGLSGGFEVPQVASCDVAGRKVFSILEPQTSKLATSLYSGEVVSYLPRDPGHILILGFTEDSDQSREMHMTLRSGEPTLYRVEVGSGLRHAVCPGSDGLANTSIGDWHVDRAGRVRAAYRSRGSETDLLYRAESTDPWITLRTFPSQSIGWRVVGFTGDDRGVYLLDYTTADTGALRVLDPVHRTLGPTLFSSPDGEIQRLLMSPDRQRLLGVDYATDRLRTHWFDPAYAALQARLDRTFPGMMNDVISLSDDESRALILSHSDRDPGSIYLLDTRTHSLGLVTPVLPGINPAQMAPMLPIRFAARDGLEIHGLLTRPLGSGGRRVPLIIHPHGGPNVQGDLWAFDPEVQFLANRGYAVLQVNYRGSLGRGTRFLHAGFNEWGGKMQDDLTDAVHWAIDQGWADPQRVAIYGASYGGYAALAGVTFTPGLYRCAVNYVGVSDLVELTRRKQASEDPGVLSFYRGTIGAEKSLLASRSPVNFVDRIRVPTFHAYGENDPRVDLAQWQELKARLEQYHKPYEFMVARDEGHGFSHREDAIAFYTRLEDFLRRNL
jgi:dipeptidyl aminopeptidase/acylaminoacyl peptidase